MKVHDTIQSKQLYFVEHYLPKSSLYEIYNNGCKLYQGKNFDKAVVEWARIVEKS